MKRRFEFPQVEEWARQRRAEARREFLTKVLPVILLCIAIVGGMIAYGIWNYNLPIEVKMEMQCRNGDAVACLALKER